MLRCTASYPNVSTWNTDQGCLYRESSSLEIDEGSALTLEDADRRLLCTASNQPWSSVLGVALLTWLAGRLLAQTFGIVQPRKRLRTPQQVTIYT